MGYLVSHPEGRMQTEGVGNTLRGMFGPWAEKVSGGRKKCYNLRLHYLPHIINMGKWGSMTWPRHIEHVGLLKSIWKKFGRIRCREKINIKKDIDCINVTHDTDHCRPLVHMVRNRWFPYKEGNLLIYPKDGQIL